MLFNSIEFIFFFLPVALVGYYLFARLEYRIAAAWLCLASLLFYGWQNPHLVAFLAGSILFNYVIGLALLASSDAARRQNWVLLCGIGVNIGSLVYFKYLFPLLNFANGVGILNHGFENVVLPLGISFFTFSQIGYLVDTKSELTKERSLLNYFLFVSFFPHLIAGPIMHHKEMMPQFANPSTYKFRVENISVGLTLFVIGLAKKVIFADRIAPWAESGFASPDTLGLFASWGAVLSYSLQLYFDFSGYSDMAIGLAKMFGVRFPLNFYSPYKSHGIIEFWQSWHMTLTRYLNLYLYNPVALAITRNRMTKGLPVGRRGTTSLGGFFSLVMFPTFFTMTIAGIWHGAGLQFLIFGLLHAIYLSINHAWQIFGPRAVEKPNRLLLMTRYAASVLLTYVAVLNAVIFFRADSTADAVTMIGGLLGMHGVENLQWALGQPFPYASTSLLSVSLYDAIEYARIWKQPLVLAFLFAVVWAMPNAHQIMGKYSPALAKSQTVKWHMFAWQPSVVWALLTGVVFFLCLVLLQNTAKFLYFQF
jgi:alginate O-acetyltransferase complex protein AlgI